jgi:ABC-type nitrate/sulfonate/bicarbonate transport system substrate-binding protein
VPPPLVRSQALSLLAAGLALLPRRARAQARVPLRVCTVNGDTFEEGCYAYELGFFSRAGFDVELSVLNNAGAVAAAVAGGAADVGTGDIVSLGNAINRGIPFVLFAGAGLYTSSSATTMLCAAKSSPVKGAKDFENGAIAVVTLVGLGTTATKAWLTQNGADLTKIKFIEMPQSDMGPALARGLVAGAVIVEPMLTAVKPDVRIVGKVYDAIAREFLISDWFTTRDWLARNAEPAKHLVGAIYETARFANAHHDQTLPILAKYTKSTPEQLRGIVRASYATTLTPALIQPVIDAAARYRSIEHAFDAAGVIAKV